MKKLIFYIFILLLLAGCVSHNNIGRITLNIADKFPESKYITAIAGAKTLIDAKMQAKAEIGSIFESKIVSTLQSRTQAVTGSDKEQSFSSEIKSDIKIVSLTVIPAIEIKQTVFDKKEGLYYAAAVLDRYKVKDIWDTEIEKLNSEIETLLNIKTESKILRLSNLKKASKIWIKKESAAVKLKIAGFPDTSASYYDIEKMFEEYTKINSSLRFYIEVSGDKIDMVKEYISYSFSAKGFVIAQSKDLANAFIMVKSKVEPLNLERKDNVKFARASISLSIEDENRNSILSIVEKNRGAHKDYDEAVFIAVKQCALDAGRRAAVLE